jgi:hypothetical protein
VDSSYYSKTGLCGGAVTVSISKYHPWQAMRFLQRSTHFSKTRCSPLITSKFIASAWKKWIGGTPSEHSPYSPDLAPCNFWAFPSMKRELRGKKFRSDQRSATRFREVGRALQEVHLLPREVLRKRDRHHTSTKFQLRVIRWVYELCKRLPYNSTSMLRRLNK